MSSLRLLVDGRMTLRLGCKFPARAQRLADFRAISYTPRRIAARSRLRFSCNKPAPRAEHRANDRSQSLLPSAKIHRCTRSLEDQPALDSVQRHAAKSELHGRRVHREPPRVRLVRAYDRLMLSGFGRGINRRTPGDAESHTGATRVGPVPQARSAAAARRVDHQCGCARLRRATAFPPAQRLG